MVVLLRLDVGEKGLERCARLRISRPMGVESLVLSGVCCGVIVVGWLHCFHYLGPSSADDAVPLLLFRVQLITSVSAFGPRTPSVTVVAGLE